MKEHGLSKCSRSFACIAAHAILGDVNLNKMKDRHPHYVKVSTLLEKGQSCSWQCSQLAVQGSRVKRGPKKPKQVGQTPLYSFKQELLCTESADI